jgi:hypothetical protein
MSQISREGSQCRSFGSHCQDRVNKSSNKVKESISFFWSRQNLIKLVAKEERAIGKRWGRGRKLRKDGVEDSNVGHVQHCNKI